MQGWRRDAFTATKRALTAPGPKQDDDGHPEAEAGR
jgi:hypothetical protein